MAAGVSSAGSGLPWLRSLVAALRRACCN